MISSIFLTSSLLFGSAIADDNSYSSPVTQPLAKDSEWKPAQPYWELQNGVATDGTSYYSITRDFTYKDVAYSSLLYSCYVTSNGPGISITLFSKRDEGLLKRETRISSKNEDDVITVYAVSGSSAKLISSWTSTVRDDGILYLDKWTSNLSSKNEIPGMYYLNSSDLITILNAERLIIRVSLDDGYLIKLYEIPMDGAKTEASRVLSLCSQKSKSI
jgi:hypothetical protein